ncbi:MAG: DUF3299 domain-containing protein [Oceanococcaceae bacterium]
MLLPSRHLCAWLLTLWVGWALADSSEPPQPAAEDIFIQIFAEGAYTSAQGLPMVDLLQGDYAYISLKVETLSGKPVVGVKPVLRLRGNSQIESLSESQAGLQTDEQGHFEFALIGGAMGLDTLSASVHAASAEMQINVLSLEAAGYPDPASVEGTVPWSELRQAKVRWSEDGSVRSEIPAGVKKHHGQRVKLAGFMLPLEPERKQKRFLLTSNPPSCFFHIPGGPAGAIEVLTDTGIEASWDLLVVEGIFESLSHSPEGVVYRLRDAKTAR